MWRSRSYRVDHDGPIVRLRELHNYHEKSILPGELKTDLAAITLVVTVVAIL